MRGTLCHTVVMCFFSTQFLSHCRSSGFSFATCPIMCAIVSGQSTANLRSDVAGRFLADFLPRLFLLSLAVIFHLHVKRALASLTLSIFWGGRRPRNQRWSVFVIVSGRQPPAGILERRPESGSGRSLRDVQRGFGATPRIPGVFRQRNP